MATRPERHRRPGSPRARLFLALDFVERDLTRLVAWCDAALAGRDDLRPVAAESLHLTLAFLGYRPEKEIEAIARAALDAVPVTAVPRLTATAVTAVPRRGPRLFALDLDDEGGRVAAIQAATSEALAAARFYEPERRAFWPHLTFARVKRGARAAPLAVAPPAGAIAVADVTLYRSHLSPRGARYEPLARITLPL